MGSSNYQTSNLQSVAPNSEKFVEIRRRIGWTQEIAARKTGYSERLIRKIERNGRVRLQTLKEVVQCYHQVLGLPPGLINEYLSRQESGRRTLDQQQLNEKCIADIKNYYLQVYHHRNVDYIRQIVCPNIRFTGEGLTRQGAEVLVQRAETFLAAFADITFSFDKIHCHNQIVVSYWSVKMRHVGNFFEIPATGRNVLVRGNSLVVFVDGVAVEAEDQFDVDDLVRQLTGQAPRII